MRKLTFLIMLAVSTASFGQGSLPPVPEKNKCYALCTTEDVYKEEDVRVMTKPAYKKVEIIPAEYKTVTETVIIKPASKKYVYVPATYKTVTQTIQSLDGYNKLTKSPSKFGDDFEVVKTKEEVQRYAATGETTSDCDDGKDCQVICTQTVPAEFKSIPIKTKIKDETTTSKPVAGKTISVSKQVEVTPAKYDVIDIPAVTKTYSKKVLVKDETVKTIEIPAEYTTIKKKVLVTKGGLQEWREISCSSLSSGQVLPINYATGSAALTASSKKIIDENLLSLMQSDPNSKVEIGSHTDALGSRSSNQVLSEKRAQSVVDYLVSKGISRSRLTAVGYGESKPTNGCKDGVSCTSAQHAANRRTEFKVL